MEQGKVAYARGAKQLIIATNPLFRAGLFRSDPIARHIVNAATGKVVNLVKGRGLDEVAFKLPSVGLIAKLSVEANKLVRATPGAIPYFSFLRDKFGHLGFEKLEATVEVCELNFRVTRDSELPCNVAAQTTISAPSLSPDSVLCRTMPTSGSCAAAFIPYLIKSQI
jgi:hypothetical protein